MESKNILIACTGSVATIKIGEIVQRFQNNSNFKFQVSQIFLPFNHHPHSHYHRLSLDQNYHNKVCQTLFK